ncbi:MAG: invasion associated locus B family protein [Gammaproteobacteria bacterium]
MEYSAGRSIDPHGATPVQFPHHASTAQASASWRRHVALVLASIFLLAPAAGAEPREGETFDNWTVRCETPKDAKKICFIFQNLVLKDSGQRVLHFAIGYVPQHPDPVALMTLPLGISLPPGATVQVDQKEPVKIGIERCEPNGCRAGLKLDHSRLEAFKTGTEVKITFHDAERKPVTVPLSLKGFTAGLRALK